MARFKKTAYRKWEEARRTTLTRFRLSRYARWPKWIDPATDTPGDEEDEENDPWEEPDTTRQVHDMTLKNYYHGPLADVEGVIKVRLARTVDDVEDAVFMILWESADHLKAFLESPALTGAFLRGLGILPEDDRPAASHFTALQFDGGFPTGVRAFEPDGLEGRITLIIMDIPYLKAKGEDREGWRKILREGPGNLAFMKDYRFPQGEVKYPRYYSSSSAYTWLVEQGNAIPKPADKAEEEEEKEIATAVCYLFQRWNVAPQLREKERALFGEPGGREKIAQAVSQATATPLVQSWRIERWDVETALCCLERCGSLEEKEASPPAREVEEGVSRICCLPVRR